MWMKRKEVYSAIMLSIVIVVFVVYSTTKNAEIYYQAENLLIGKPQSQNYGRYPSAEGQEYSRVITETIKGKLDRGTFEGVIGELEILTGEAEGYVQSLHMTYQDNFWSGTMICKLPSNSVTFFTFDARAIIEANGTVTYININVENINASGQSHTNSYSTVNLRLHEIKPENGENEIIVSIASALPILTTSLVWIAEGLAIVVPLSFVFLGIVLLINRGIIPLWKNTLRKPK
jgi:hypothetical protein